MNASDSKCDSNFGVMHLLLNSYDDDDWSILSAFKALDYGNCTTAVS